MKISFRKTGQGPTLILLHGYAGSVLHWKPVAQELQADFSVVVVNYGHFYLGRAAISFSEQVDQLAHWLREHFPHEKVSLAGISFGGALVWGLGAKYPELLANTIFVNPMPPRPMRFFGMKAMRLFLRIPLSRAAVFLFLSTGVGAKFLKNAAEIFRFQSEESMERLSSVQGKKRIFIAHLFNNFAWILRREKWTRWEQLLKNWTLRSLVIYDSHDPLFHKDGYLKLCEQLGTKNIETLDHGGHLAILAEPLRIAGHMRHFLMERTPVHKKTTNTAA